MDFFNTTTLKTTISYVRIILGYGKSESDIMKNIEKYLNKFYDFIDKIGKHNFILIIFVFIVFLITGLYQTFSLYTENEGLSILNGKDTYSFILDASNETNSVTIASGASKNIDITVRNDSDLPLKYGLYSSEESNTDTNFIFGYSTVTKHLPNGVIPAKTNYIVTLKVYNYSDYNQTIDFGVQYGFDNDEELTLENGQYWIKELCLMKKLFNINTDTTYFAAYRPKISEVSFVDLDTYSIETDANVIASWNIAATNSDDDSVTAWITEKVVDNTTQTKLYIGAKEMIYSEDLQSFFSGMTSLTNINFTNLDTSLTKGMERLFYDCILLENLDLSSFDTSNVTSMLKAFSRCKSLTNLNLSSFNTRKVTNMKNMFELCQKLTLLSLSNFDTSKVTTMEGMFSECRKLNTLDIKNFDTINVVDMSNMFTSCFDLRELDLSHFSTSNVTSMAGMFSECSLLSFLDISNFNTSNVTNMAYMFFNCSTLSSLDLSSFDTSNVIDMTWLFDSCFSLVSLDISNFDTSKVTVMTRMFSECENLMILDIKNFDTSSVTNFDYMFYKCHKLQYRVYDTLLGEGEQFKIIIKNKASLTPTYRDMFTNAATVTGSEIKVYYEDNTLELVKNMVNTKSPNSNVFVAPRLVDMEVGDYVKYGLDDIKWRIAYIKDGSAHLISAGTTEKICTGSNGTPLASGCSDYLDENNLYKHFNNLNNIALTYCNTTYAKGGVCNSTTAWAMNATDFKNITSSDLSSTSCFQVSSTACGADNTLINIDEIYWYATATDQVDKRHGAFIWHPTNDYVAIFNSGAAGNSYGVRPVLALDSSVFVKGGSGTSAEPYEIDIIK